MLTARLEKGQTLIETVAAMAVAVIIIAALVGMAVTSLRSSNLSRSKAIATQLLSEEIERIRIYRDNSANAYFSGLKSDLGLTSQVCGLAVVGPLYINGSQVINSGSETVTSNSLEFTRSLTACLTDSVAKVIEVTATVSWTDSAGTHPLRSTTYFSDWRN